MSAHDRIAVRSGFKSGAVVFETERVMQIPVL